MNSRYVENLQDGIEERSTLMAKKFREQFEGMGPGMKDTRGDREFLAWFFYMGSQYGVDWVRALEFVDGGKDLLRRFVKLTEPARMRAMRAEGRNEIVTGSWQANPMGPRGDLDEMEGLQGVIRGAN